MPARCARPQRSSRVSASSRLIISTGWIISILALIVGGIGVTNTMAMSVFERTRELGILRAVGWPTRRIGSMIVGETVAICLLALGVGLGLGILAAHQLTGTDAKVSLGSFPPLLIVIDAIAGALLAALGCWMVARRRPKPGTAPSAQG